MYVHCGFDFYLSESFKISCKWSKVHEQTRYVSNKISPLWGEILEMRGLYTKPIVFNVMDSKSNILEWLRIQP